MSNFKRLKEENGQSTPVQEHSPNMVVFQSEEPEPVTSTRPTYSNNARQTLASVLNTVAFDIFVVVTVILFTIIVLIEICVDLQVFSHEKAAHKPIRPYVAARLLHALAMSIMGVFFVEMCFRCYAFGWKMIYDRLEMFDLTIVMVSFGFELFCITHEDAFSGTGLFIILRIWRIASIFNALLRNVEIDKDRQINTIKLELSSIRALNERYREQVDRFKAKVRYYQLELESRGIPVDHDTDLSPSEDLVLDLRDQTRLQPVLDTPDIISSAPLSFNIPEEANN